ncbi:MAG TPA: hypothetical protein VMU45_02055 [Candidatus Eisenbacteria bacterium]|nr:hypothetical protein [Candidatus Eisenbacteria bacterium]
MQSQKRMFVVLAVMMVLGAATLVAANNPMGIAQKQEINFTAPTVVGGSLLPAGEYKVLHQMQGTEHIMIFKQINGKAEAKAKCNLVPLTEKAKITEQRYTENAKNERVLIEMTFRGDSAKHVLEP